MAEENKARVFGRSLPISTKQSIEICNFLRGRTTEESKKLLEGVIAKKIAVPFKRFNKDMGHKRGKIASGRFPNKASEHILKLIKSVEANAKNIGLIGPFVIESIIPNQAARSWHYGRQRRRKNKRTHIEIVEKEGKKEVKNIKEKKPIKKETKEDKK